MGIAQPRLQRGDIVITPFPFTDMSGARVRPALIVSADTSKADVILAFISSVIPIGTPAATEYMLDTRDAEFAMTGLKTTQIPHDRICVAEVARLREFGFGQPEFWRIRLQKPATFSRGGDRCKKNIVLIVVL